MTADDAFSKKRTDETMESHISRARLNWQLNSEIAAANFISQGKASGGVKTLLEWLKITPLRPFRFSPSTAEDFLRGTQKLINQ